MLVANNEGWSRNLRLVMSEGKSSGNIEMSLWVGFKLLNCNSPGKGLWVAYPLENVYVDCPRLPHNKPGKCWGGESTKKMLKKVEKP